jgi:ABC-type amino acid transport system permease subunit
LQCRHQLKPTSLHDSQGGSFRVALPPLGNVFVFLLKAATYAAGIAVPELVYTAEDISTTYFKPFEAFSAVAVILVILVITFSLAVASLERSLKRS